MDASEFTVFFEDPFWVGILVRGRGRRGPGSGVEAARVVFGAEPGNAELLAFMRDRFSDLQRTARAVPPEEAPRLRPGRGPASAKRCLRAAARDQARGAGKAAAAAHAAFELERERAAAERKAALRERKSGDYGERSRKRKAARRGK